MKYKDFKVMSQNEMKNVKGGYPPDWGGCVATCNNNATFAVCSCAGAEQFCNFYGEGLRGCSCQGNPDTCA